MRHLIIVRGGGELGTAVAHRLHRAGYKVLILEKSLGLVLSEVIQIVIQKLLQMVGIDIQHLFIDILAMTHMNTKLV